LEQHRHNLATEFPGTQILSGEHGDFFGGFFYYGFVR